MKHQYYLPVTDTGKAVWLATFAVTLATYAAALGITPAQLAAVQADADFFGEVVTSLPGFKDYFQTVTTYKNQLRDGSEAPIGGFPAPPAAPATPAVLAGVFKRNTELVRTIKAHPAYTETMGQNLGIIGAEIDTDFGTIQPEPKTSLKNGHAYVQWNHEHTDSADVYADYGDGAGFVSAGRIASTHFLDPHLPAAGQSKVYKFKLRYVVNDEQVGIESDPVSVTVTG